MAEPPPHAERQQSRIWFGAAGLLDGSRGWEERGPLAHIDVPAESLTRDHTVRLSWLLPDAASARVLTGGAGEPVALRPGAPVFDGFTVTEPLAGALRGIDAPTPLFITVRTPSPGGGQRLRTFSRLQFAAADGLFLLTGDDVVPGGLPDHEDAAEALRRHRTRFLRLNNAVWSYEKSFPGTEIEYKLTIRQPVDIWALSIKLYRLLHEGRIRHFRPEFGSEYEGSEFRNHLYGISDPPEERGYVSFIPMAGGKYLVRRKWFERDTLVRREEIQKDVVLSTGFADHIAENFAVAATSYPVFTRIRYDLNIESMRTGHIYGVFFDRCEAEGHPDEPLQQCEVEYLRTRTVLETDASRISEELALLKDAVAEFLKADGICFEDSYLSKLSWLRDLGAGSAI